MTVKIILLPLLNEFFKPLLGRTTSRGRCWAPMRLSHNSCGCLTKFG